KHSFVSLKGPSVTGDFPVADPHGGSGANGLKGLRGKALTCVSEFLVVSHALIVGHGSNFLLFPVDKAYEFQSRSPWRHIDLSLPYCNYGAWFIRRYTQFRFLTGR